MPLKTKDTNLEADKLTTITKKSTTKKQSSKRTSSSTKSSKNKSDSKTSPKQTTKTSTSKKAVNSKSTTSKNKTSSNKKRSTKNVKKVDAIQVLEYYDLPYRYNETVVKILAQTPKILFVYWDISDKDKENYIKQFGNNFFSESSPFLLIHNETKNYDFEVEINDFANSWYLKVDDANCKYRIDLCRRFNKTTENLYSNYLRISSSNDLSTPNDHVLLENFNSNITFKNTKNNTISIKNFGDFIPTNNISNLYKMLYKSNFNKIFNNTLSNPSSIFFNN